MIHINVTLTEKSDSKVEESLDIHATDSTPLERILGYVVAGLIDVALDANMESESDYELIMRALEKGKVKIDDKDKTGAIFPPANDMPVLQ